MSFDLTAGAEFAQKFALEENSGRDSGRKNARIGGISDGN